MIKKRGNRWRVVVQCPPDPLSGKRSQLSGSAPTEREAVKLEKEFLLQAESGIRLNISFADLVAEWWASPPRLAPTTAKNYRENLDNHVLPVLGPKKVRDIRPRLVGQFLAKLLADGMSPATARKVRTVFSAVMSYAVAMEYAESNPVMKVPPPPLEDGERVAPTIEETAQLLLYAEEHDPDFLTYLWVAAEEGGRRGESLALRWGGIDFDNGTITIDSTVSVGLDGAQVRNRTKNKKPRTIAVSKLTLDHLAAHKAAVERDLSEAAGTEVVVGPSAFGVQRRRRQPPQPGRRQAVAPGFDDPAVPADQAQGEGP